jgi:Luciferase-like monooxygenase
MDFGINLATSADSWKVVKRAEELGYSSAWFYDTQMLGADVFVAMGAAAVQTTRIRLGTGVLNIRTASRRSPECAGVPQRSGPRADRFRCLDGLHGPANHGFEAGHPG